MPLILENKLVSILKLIQQLDTTWVLLCYPCIFTCFALFLPKIFFLKRKTDIQHISSAGWLLSTSCYTLCFLLEAFWELPVLYWFFELSFEFPLNCLLEQPNTVMASQMDRGSSMLESFHLWVRGGLLGQTFSLSLQWTLELLILTCCDQTLEAAGSQHQPRWSARFFSALWMGCPGWDAGPRMLLGLRECFNLACGLLCVLSLSCHVDN